MFNPSISVVIPLYNGGETIERTIRSILDSDVDSKDIQLIVVDDGSTDRSLDLAIHTASGKFHLSSKFVCQLNQGACAARNHGLSLAQAHWVVFLDCDDFYKKDFLSAVVQLGHEEKILFGNYQLFNGAYTSQMKLKRDLDVKQAIANGSFTIPGAVATSRAIAMKYQWNTNLAADQDGEWMGRMVFSGVPFDFAPETGVIYNTGNPHSISKNKTHSSFKSRVASAEVILDLINAQSKYTPYKKSIAARLDLIAFSYFHYFPSECKKLRKRALTISPHYRHQIKGKKGLIRNLFGFHLSLAILKILKV